MRRHVLPSGVGVSLLILFGVGLLGDPSRVEAQAITMRLQETCGVPADHLRVLIAYPPGGCERVKPDGTVTVNVPAGTSLLVVSVVPDQDPLSRAPLVGIWTPAANEGLLKVTCTGR